MKNTSSFAEPTIDNSVKPVIARFPKVSDSATSMVVVE